jgi:hypothetical protein
MSTPLPRARPAPPRALRALPRGLAAACLVAACLTTVTSTVAAEWRPGMAGPPPVGQVQWSESHSAPRALQLSEANSAPRALQASASASRTPAPTPSPAVAVSPAATLNMSPTSSGALAPTALGALVAGFLVVLSVGSVVAVRCGDRKEAAVLVWTWVRIVTLLGMVVMRFCMLLSASAASGELSPWPCFVSPTLVDITANGVTAIKGGGMTVLQVCAPSSAIAASPYVAPFLPSVAQLDYVPVDINKLTPSVPSLGGSLRMETVMAWLWTPFAVVVWIAVMEFPWHLLSWLLMEEGVTAGRVVFRLLMLPLMFTAISCLFPGFTHPHVLSLTCIPTSGSACGAVAGVASAAYGRAWTFFIVATIYWLLIAAACIVLAIVIYIFCSKGNWHVQVVDSSGNVMREWIEDNTAHDAAVSDLAKGLVMPVPCCIILAAGMLIIWVLAAPIASIAGNIEVASATQTNRNWPLQPLASTPIGFSTVIPTQQSALTAVHVFGMLTSFLTMISLAARAAVTIIDKYNPPKTAKSAALGMKAAPAAADAERGDPGASGDDTGGDTIPSSSSAGVEGSRNVHVSPTTGRPSFFALIGWPPRFWKRNPLAATPPAAARNAHDIAGVADPATAVQPSPDDSAGTQGRFARASTRRRVSMSTVLPTSGPQHAGEFTFASPLHAASACGTTATVPVALFGPVGVYPATPNVGHGKGGMDDHASSGESAVAAWDSESPHAAPPTAAAVTVATAASQSLEPHEPTVSGAGGGDSLVVHNPLRSMMADESDGGSGRPATVLPAHVRVAVHDAETSGGIAAALARQASSPMRIRTTRRG